MSDITKLTGPELSEAVAIEMGYETTIEDRQHVFIIKNGELRLFNPHENMNDVRKIWEWIFSQPEVYRWVAYYQEELRKLTGSIQAYAMYLATPEQHCQAFLMACRRVKGEKC